MATNKDLQNIITPVNVKQLEALLNETGYEKKKTEYLVQGFSNGFDLGYRGKMENIQQKAPNLKFTIGNKTILWNKVMKEVQNKRYAGPFEEIPFKDFIQSPIGLVPKDGGKKTRLIFHLSFPRGKDPPESVNGNTPEELTKVKYKDFDQAIKLCILEGGKWVYIGKSDLSNAFRHLPIAKKFWKFLVMKALSPIDGKWYYFVDKCLPFGASISCAAFQAFSDALAHIVKAKTGKDNVNYLDDFLFVALLKALCNLQVEMFIKICNLISFPVSLEKTFWATRKLVFLGLLIDTINAMVSIPEEKISKGKAMVQKMRNKKKTTLRELQELTGFLNFLNKCMVPGRTFTRRMYQYGTNLTKPHHHLPVNQELKMDLNMWWTFLNHASVYARPFFHFQEVYYTPQQFSSDASRNPLLGCGGICNTDWYMQQWDYDFMEKYEPSINYLELYALTVAVKLWIGNFNNQNITIFCDNQSVIHMVNKGTSKCRQSMVLIRYLTLLCLTHNTKLNVEYIPSKRNTSADLLSRMNYKEFIKNAKREKLLFKRYPEKIPEDLWPMSKIWLE